MIPTPIPTSIPSTIPSLIPSSGPTVSPDCFTDEIIGKKYLVTVLKILCLEIDMSTVNGKLYLVAVDFSNPVCTSTATASAARTAVSDLVNPLPVGGIEAIFDGSNYAGGWSGKVLFVEDDNQIGVGQNIISMKTTSRTFEIEIVLPSCSSPSLAPSNYPTLVPSLKPSLQPSTLPTRVPECDISEVSGNGRTYYLAVLSLCLKLELWTGGNLDEVLTSLSNIECTDALARSLPTRTLSTWSSATSSKAFYVGAYDGNVVVSLRVVESEDCATSCEELGESEGVYIRTDHIVSVCLIT